MTPIKAIIFDKDGTIHDTEKVFLKAWQAAADDCGGIPDIVDTIKDCTGVNVPDTKVYWEKKYPHIPFELFWERRQYHFNEMLRNGVPVKEGAIELLTYLNTHGYKVGMATSTPGPEAMKHMEQSDLVKYFHPDAIITGDMPRHGKPAPDIYLMAAERMGVDPADCIGVEDSPNGVRAIHAAGMRPIMIPDQVEPNAEIEAIMWKRLDCLLDMIPLLESVEHT